MADRLISAVAIGAFAVVALLACGTTNAPSRASAPSDVAALRADVRDAASALGRYYGIANDAVLEAYVARARAEGAPVGRSERCRRPDGRIGTRPTALGHPLLASSSIRQRSVLVATIGAYDVALEARAAGADASAVDDADRALRDRVIDLGVAADTHADGDLFIEDLTHALGRAIADAGFGSHALRRAGLDASDDVVRELLDVLASDVARQRTDTVDAAALAYRVWARAGNASQTHGARVRRDPPACSEPAIFARESTRPEALATQATSPRGETARATRARERLGAMRSADPERVVRALASLGAALARAVARDAPTEIGASADTFPDVRTAADRFREAVRAFVDVLRSRP